MIKRLVFLTLLHLCIMCSNTCYANDLLGTKVNFMVLAAGTPYTQGSASGHVGTPRTPINPPTVYLDGHMLSFLYAFSDDIEVQLLDSDTMDDDEPTVVYTTEVRAGTQVVYLPTTYTGEYGIRLVVGQWYFIGVIDL